MIKVKTHGKLYIAGEYQVLNTSGNAIIYGMDRYIHIMIEASDKYLYKSRNKNYYFTFENNSFNFSNNNKIVNQAIIVAFKYLKANNIAIKTFKINIKSELESNKGLKYGFGSSSAIISGMIKAILLFHDVEVDNLLIYKLSVIAQIKAKAITSGGDLAAAIYGGYIYYERYNLEFVLNNIENKDLLNIDWPGLKIEKMHVRNINIMAVWSKKVYRTKPLENVITKKDYKYANRLVKTLKVGLEENKFKLINKAIAAYDQWLVRILKGTNRYIDEFNIINDVAKKHQLSSKLSGAGGGDSAIILYNNENENSLLENFKKLNYKVFLFK